MRRFILPTLSSAVFAFGAVGVSDAINRGKAAPEAPAVAVLLCTLAATFGAAAVTGALESVTRD